MTKSPSTFALPDAEVVRRVRESGDAAIEHRTKIDSILAFAELTPAEREHLTRAANYLDLAASLLRAVAR